MAKRTYARIMTLPATASYSYLREPDSGREYSDDKYKVTILIDKADEAGLSVLRKAIAEAAQSEWPEGMPKNAHMPVRDGADKSEELSNYFIVTFKSKQAPQLVDAAGKPLADGVNIYSGDKIRVAGAAGAYVAGSNKGVTLYLNGVQLIEKQASESDGPLFGAVEGGFVNPEGAEAPVAAETPASDGPSFSF